MRVLCRARNGQRLRAIHYSRTCATIVNVEKLAKSLNEARSRQGMTLETVSKAAKISPAYLYKLEAERVRTPSPHVLRRLATVLGVPYLTLMTLAGYLADSESAAGAERTADGTPGRKGEPMKQSTTSGGPTNAEILRQLQAVRVELTELRRGQDELAKNLGKTTPRKSNG
jgi:transcriptional regulator with XRE-family HTH domain